MPVVPKNKPKPEPERNAVPEADAATHMPDVDDESPSADEVTAVRDDETAIGAVKARSEDKTQSSMPEAKPADDLSDLDLIE